MKVYIFYNGLDYFAPEDGAWSQFRGENNARLFLACAASWAKQGWEPVRLTTLHDSLTRKIGGFSFQGILKRDIWKYGIHLWDIWHQWKMLAPCYVSNIDVINQTFFPPEKPWHRATAMHVNGWTASVGFVTPDYCEKVIKVIEEVDAGTIAAPPCEMFCDDAIVRHICPPPVHLPYCDFTFIKQGWQHSPLIQLPRSTIIRSMKEIPVV